MDSIARDLRFGLRLLLKNPGHTIAAVLALVSLVLSLVAFVACWIPAQRAAETDPLVAIRYD